MTERAGLNLNKKNKKRAYEILLEQYQFKSVKLVPESLLVLYSTGNFIFLFLFLLLIIKNKTGILWCIIIFLIYFIIIFTL